MKKQILFFSLLMLVVLASSCSDDDTKQTRVLPTSSGRVNEMIVVVKHDQWKGKLGKTIREIFQKEIEGLPQAEPLFRVANVDPSAYNDIFKSARNILIIEIKKGSKAKLSFANNVHSMPQTIEHVLANSEQEAISLMQKYRSDLVSAFRTQDIESVQKRLKRIARFDIPDIKEKGISIILPKSYMPVEFGENFWWYRADIKEGKNYPTLNFMLYIYPMENELDLSGGNIIAMRDSIAKKYIAGPTDGSYMQTELRPNLVPTMKNTIVDSKLAIETRGLWMVKNDYMGGPFLSYTIFDEEKKRVITAEGFIYAAGTKKRDYVFEIEAIIKSLKID